MSGQQTNELVVTSFSCFEGIVIHTSLAIHGFFWALIPHPGYSATRQNYQTFSSVSRRCRLAPPIPSPDPGQAGPDKSTNHASFCATWRLKNRSVVPCPVEKTARQVLLPSNSQGSFHESRKGVWTAMPSVH